jgi:DNA-binding MarR family transcriptional regulator
MTRKLETSGHIKRTPDPTDKRATVVALTDSGKALAEQIRQLWLTLAGETISGLPAEMLEQLPGILHTMSTNVSGKPA